MKTIKMKMEMTGSDVDKEGVTIGPNTYLKDQVYKVGDGLARAFCDQLKAADYVEKAQEENKNTLPVDDQDLETSSEEVVPEQNEEEVPEEQAQEKAKEKAQTGAPENKASKNKNKNKKKNKDK